MEAVCRACGKQENLKKLELCGEGVLQKLLICASISIQQDDVLPKVICSDCEEDLDFCYRFRVRAIETEQNLRQLLARIELQSKASLRVLNEEDLDGAVDGHVDGTHKNPISSRNALITGIENERKLFDGLKNEFLCANSLSSYGDITSNSLTKIETPDNLSNAHQSDIDGQDDSNGSQTIENNLDIEDSKDFMVTTTFANIDGGLICLEETDGTLRCLDDEDDNGNEQDRKDNMEFNAMESWNEGHSFKSFDDASNNKIIKEEDLLLNAQEKVFKNSKVHTDSHDSNINNDDVVEIISSDDEENSEDSSKHLTNIPDDEEDDSDLNADVGDGNFSGNHVNAEDFFFLDDDDDDDDDIDDEDENDDETVLQSLHLPTKNKNQNHGVEDVDMDEPSDERGIDVSKELPFNVANTNGIETINSNKVNVLHYTCATCKMEFTKQSDYQEHIKDHGQQRYSCEICNMWFSTPCRLKIHALTHSNTSNSFQRISCEICQRTYLNKKSLIRHIKQSHPNNPPTTCKICGYNAALPERLDFHMKSHTRETSLSCKTCSKKFKNIRTLKKHMKLHLMNTTTNEEKSKSYYCVHCGEVSATHTEHKNHYRTHYKELPFKCDVCEKAFTTMAALISHEYAHANNRPYQCEHCLMSFPHVAQLSQHKKTHLKNFIYKCVVCSIRFDDETVYASHIKTHNSNEILQCSQCDEEFETIELLSKHCHDKHADEAKQKSAEADERRSTNENPTSSQEVSDTADTVKTKNKTKNKSIEAIPPLRRKSSFKEECSKLQVKRKKS